MIIHKIEELISESDNTWEYVYEALVPVPGTTGITAAAVDKIINNDEIYASVAKYDPSKPAEFFNPDAIVVATKTAEQSAKEVVTQAISKFTQAISKMSDKVSGVKDKAEEGIREFKTFAVDISNKSFTAVTSNPLVERVREFSTSSPYMFYAIVAAIPVVFAGLVYAGIKIKDTSQAKTELDKAETELSNAKTKSQKKVAMKKIASIGAQGLVLSKK